MVREPLSTIILNEPSLAKFQPRLHRDGVQVVNASLVNRELVDTTRERLYIRAYA